LLKKIAYYRGRNWNLFPDGVEEEFQFFRVEMAAGADAAAQVHAEGLHLIYRLPDIGGMQASVDMASYRENLEVAAGSAAYKGWLPRGAPCGCPFI
jgi:hypothetical protein